MLDKLKKYIIALIVYASVITAMVISDNYLKDKDYRAVLKLENIHMRATGFAANYENNIIGITNYHVCEDFILTKLELFAIDAFGNRDNVYPISWDAHKDLCLFKLGRKLKPAPADFDLETKAENATKASVWGYPSYFNLTKVEGLIFNDYTVKFGCNIVGCVVDGKNFQLIHTEILNGNSGSPVLLNHKVIGVILATDEYKHGYLVPNVLLKEFLVNFSRLGIMASWN